MKRLSFLHILCTVAMGSTTLTRFGMGQDAHRIEPSGGYRAAIEAMYATLVKQRVIIEESGSLETLRSTLMQAESDYLTQRYLESAVHTLELTESPRYLLFRGSPEHTRATLILAKSFSKLGGKQLALEVLGPLLQQPAPVTEMGADAVADVWTDICLSSATLPSCVDATAKMDPQTLKRLGPNADYLRGRALLTSAPIEAERFLVRIPTTHRWYIHSLYLRAAMASRLGQLQQAKTLLCRIAALHDTDEPALRAGAKYFQIRDLARMGLGRLAHEINYQLGSKSYKTRYAREAFYHYLQVPQDSEFVAQALLEAAYSLYEAKHSDIAADLIDQLDARFGHTNAAQEGLLLRGYLALEQCNFVSAGRDLLAFERRTAARLADVHAALNDAPRRAALLAANPTASHTWLSKNVQTKSAELLNVYQKLEQAKTITQTASWKPSASGKTLPMQDPAQNVTTDLLEDKITTIGRALDAMRSTLRFAAATGSETQTRTLNADLIELGKTHARLQRDLRRLDSLAEDTTAPDTIWKREATGTNTPTTVSSPMPYLTKALRQLAVAIDNNSLAALEEEREQLAQQMRQARLGRIDAVMGTKRQLENQIEILAQGRLPRSLDASLKVKQGLLRDDEEYWPQDGEQWEDEK